jgi:hypothetical protein
MTRIYDTFNTLISKRYAFVSNMLNLDTPAGKRLRLLHDLVPKAVRVATLVDPCPFRKSYPRVAMMQSGKDWYGDDSPGSLDGSP